MNRAYYSASISAFRIANSDGILGRLAPAMLSPWNPQCNAWLEEISTLKCVLALFEGSIYFEYSIPRMGKRIDVVALIGPAIFVLEFKVGEREFAAHSIDQVVDYALDLKNFQETSSEHKTVVEGKGAGY